MRVDIPADRPRLELQLSDGMTIWLSPLLSGDKHSLEEGFEELSLESRYNRFGQGLGHLTESELNYLTNIDQRYHVAWGASTMESEGIGIGRYIVTAHGCAEVALTVMDDWQGRGVGKLLLRVLAAIARSDGVSQLCFKFVPGNRQIRAMLQGIEVEFDETDGLMSGALPIESIPAPDWEDDAVAVLDQVRF